MRSPRTWLLLGGLLTSAKCCFLAAAMFAGVVSFFPCPRLSAQTIATEAFGYVSGAVVNGANGGVGWQQTWQGGDITVASGSLSFPAHESGGLAGTASGNRVDYTASTGAQDFSTRQMTTAIDFSQAGTYYSSVLLRKFANGGNGPGVDQIAVKFYNTAQSIQRWGFGLGSDEWFFVETGPDNPTWWVSEAGVNLSTTYFMISKLVTSAAGDDEWFLSYFGPSDIVPTNEPENWDVSFTGNLSDAGIDVVRLDFGSNAAGAIDEFRFGSSWGAVTTAIPESSAIAALAGIGAMGFALWRRRRPSGRFVRLRQTGGGGA